MNKIRKPWILVPTSLLIIGLFSSLPIIPVDKMQKGKEMFVFRVQTKELLHRLEYEVEVSPSSFNYLNMRIINHDLNYSQIIFECNDWILDVKFEPKTLMTNTMLVTYYNPPMTRMEAHIEGLYIELSINYTNRRSRIQSTFKRVLVSEAVSGEFDIAKYLENAEAIPLKDFKFSFDQIEIINKETNASTADFQYNPEGGYYIRHIIAKISYDLYYSTTLASSDSAFSVILSNLGITFSNQIFSAVVAFFIAYYEVRSRNKEITLLKTKLMEQEKKSTETTELPTGEQ